MPSGVRPSSLAKRAVSSDPAGTDSLDALYRVAGLVRAQHGARQRHARSAPLDRLAPEELTPLRPIPVRAPNGVEWLTVNGWDLPWLWSGFSTRKGGLSRAYCADDSPDELNLGFTEADERKAVLANRGLLSEAVTGNTGTPIVAVRQFHSNLVVDTIFADAARPAPRRADGHITREPGLLLAIQTADCIPVLVADRRKRVVAAFHAGWRGTVKRIVETGVGRMRLLYGCRPQDLIAVIGPGASACCYAVGEEVRGEFESQFAYARELFHEVYDSEPIKKKYPMLFLTQRAPGHSPIGPSLHVDLVEANRRQLLDSGLRPRAIQLTGGCTQCMGDLFFSHRASQGRAGRMMAVIGIRPKN